MSAQECERMEQLVGSDCDDPDIICEGEDPGACCVEGACVQVGIKILKNAIKVPSTWTQTNAS